MSAANSDEEGVGRDEGVNDESSGEWLADQAVLGGEILAELRAAIAKRKLPAVAYLMALYIEYAAIRDELVCQAGESKVRELEEGFSMLADAGAAIFPRSRDWNPMYA